MMTDKVPRWCGNGLEAVGLLYFWTACLPFDIKCKQLSKHQFWHRNTKLEMRGKA